MYIYTQPNIFDYSIYKNDECMVYPHILEYEMFLQINYDE